MILTLFFQRFFRSLIVNQILRAVWEGYVADFIMIKFKSFFRLFFLTLPI